jgi:hypothetical protein
MLDERAGLARVIPDLSLTDFRLYRSRDREQDVGWGTLNLTPGRYELVCNQTGHYAAGMFAELDVTA